jgi:signal peptidase II
VIAVDQVTKAVVVTAIGPGEAVHRIELADNWLAIEYAENRGVAFGLMAGLGPFLLLLAGAVLLGLVIHYVREPSPPIWHSLALGLIGGGAMGNLIDRVRVGYVIDFIAVGSWPNFNIADSAISIGVAVLFWGWLVGEHVAPTANAI